MFNRETEQLLEPKQKSSRLNIAGFIRKINFLKRFSDRFHKFNNYVYIENENE